MLGKYSLTYMLPAATGLLFIQVFSLKIGSTVYGEVDDDKEGVENIPTGVGGGHQ